MKLSSTKTIFLSLIFLTPLTLGEIASAENFKSLDSLNIDTSISLKVDKRFGIPTKILVTPITLSDKKIVFNKWIKGIYYYTVDKLGFQDIPYHYFINENGEVFTANSSGDEKEVTIEGLGENNVIIGYLNTSGNDYINPDSESSLAQLILDISNRNGVNPHSTIIAETNFVKDKTTNTVTIESKNITGGWDQSLRKIIESIKDKYTPTAKTYSVEVTDISLPSSEVEPGSETSVSIKIKNTGTSGFYQGSTSELVLTKENESTSNFYVNNVWLSQSQASIMGEDEPLLPGNEKIFEFKIKAPLAVGSYSEKFILKTLSGSTIKINNLVEIKVNLKKSDKQIIEIKPNASGAVNVRKTPNDATVVRRVTPGERFYLLDLNQQTLWAQIDLGDGTTGYIAAWQFSYL